MECFIVEQSDVREEELSLTLVGDEAHHVRVLRVRIGEQILVTNLLGTCYECELTSQTERGKKEQEAICRILAVCPSLGEPANSVWLIQAAIAQPARWEWLLEKATELGVKVIMPVTTERTERATINHARGERVLRAAVKQTKRANKPWLKELSSLEEALNVAGSEKRLIFILHEATNPDDLLQKHIAKAADESVAIVVGPEGGFTDNEIKLATQTYGAIPVSLGPRRLRAETAAVAALALAIKG